MCGTYLILWSQSSVKSGGGLYWAGGGGMMGGERSTPVYPLMHCYVCLYIIIIYIIILLYMLYFVYKFDNTPDGVLNYNGRRCRSGANHQGSFLSHEGIRFFIFSSCWTYDWQNVAIYIIIFKKVVIIKKNKHWYIIPNFAHSSF